MPYKKELNTLRTLVAGAKSKGDGLNCAHQFVKKVAPDSDFQDDCVPRSMPQLVLKLNRASVATGGKGGIATDFLCIDDAGFYFCEVKIDGRESVLIYFDDFLKGLVYIKTGAKSFEIYYFSIARNWTASN